LAVAALCLEPLGALADDSSSDGKATGALITAALSLLGTAITVAVGYFQFSRQTAEQRRLQSQADEHATSLAKLTGSQTEALERQKFEQSINEEVLKAEVARVARSRQLLEEMASRLKGAAQRVRFLAELSREERSASVLANNQIQYKRTIYDLFAPIAAARLVVDAALLERDPYVANLVKIANALLDLPAADAEFARAANLPYKPGELERDGAAKIPDNFRIYDRQGVTLVEALLEEFVDRGEAGSPASLPYVISEGDFVARFSKPDGFDERISEAGALVAKFKPRDKPVFWQLLIAEVTLARLATRARGDLVAACRTLQFSPEERRGFDWRARGDAAVSDTDALERPFSVALAWAAARLSSG
jgi:hypothetical protein